MIVNGRRSVILRILDIRYGHLNGRVLVVKDAIIQCEWHSVWLRTSKTALLNGEVEIISPLLVIPYASSLDPQRPGLNLY